MRETHDGALRSARADPRPRLARRRRRPPARLGGRGRPRAPRSRRCRGRWPGARRSSGARLFERVPDGVRPTPAGALVVDAARDLTSRYGQLVALARPGPRPRDGAGPAGVPRLHGHVARARRCCARSTRTRRRSGSSCGRSRGTRSRATSGSARSTSPSPRSPPPGAYGWHVLQEERLVLVVPRHAPVARPDGGRPGRAGVGGADHHARRASGTASSSTACCARRAWRPSISFESQDLATIEGLVAAGLGVAVLPEAFAGHSGTVGLRADRRGRSADDRADVAHRPGADAAGAAVPGLRRRTDAL